MRQLTASQKIAILEKQGCPAKMRNKRLCSQEDSSKIAKLGEKSDFKKRSSLNCQGCLQASKKSI